LSNNQDFKSTSNQTPTALDSQNGVELVLRFLAFRNFAYQPGLDVHEYLDEALIGLATNSTLDMAAEGAVFERTFRILNSAMGETAFKKWDGNDFKGMFLMSVYEVMATGVARNLDAIEAIPQEQRDAFIINRAKELWRNPAFTQSSGAGVRGTTRLTKLLPIAAELLKP
jgi:hypothetical protein